ncbi:MAG: hypothetical protein JRH20_26360, partial [Deltaproteobacteria bacterium]|nr:hypothetical protein [Deltaproteobacteria bacterium]
YVAFVFGDNIFIRIAARFIMAALGVRSYGQYPSIEEALVALSDD